MVYKVIENFFDAEDNKRLYEVGQTYPRAGFEASQERIDYLSNKNGDFKKPFIKIEEDREASKNVEPGEVETDDKDEFPKHTGGGYYELSNGEKVKGKKEAEKAEADLKDGE